MVVASAAALAEKVPDPELRPHGFPIEKGGLLDLEETAAQLVACGYERVDQVEERGQFALRGDILDIYPATEERAVRCELFDVEVERLTFFSTFTQRSLEEVEQRGDRAGRRAGARAPRAGRDRRAAARRTSARTSPSCCPWTASASCSTCCPTAALRGGGGRGGAASPRCATSGRT